MAAYNKFNSFVEALNEGVHDMDTHTFMVALTNTAPTATNTVLADIVQIVYTNLSSRVLVLGTSSQVAGTYNLVFNDLVLTSTGGPTGPFRYVVIYNDTPTVPADPLVGWYDYGAAITLLAGETLTIDFTAAGLYSMA